MADNPAIRCLAIGLAVVAGCAVPVPPSGGPTDSTPPSVVVSRPENGSVRFEGDAVRIEFDEYVDQRSVGAAVSVTPSPARAPEIRYGGKHIEIRFREPLRDSTTYIVTLDTQFKDAHGVALARPVTVAFSTGDRIDGGRLAGRVLESDSGRPAASVDVFAFDSPGGAPPDSIDADPVYRTQTDTEGRFRFEYLAERPFFVLAGRDLNRNRRLDPGEPFAVPPGGASTADSAGTEPDRPWLIAARDHAPPELRRTAARSSTRLELLFSEGLEVLDSGGTRWSLDDSTGMRKAAVRLSDVMPGDPRTLVLRTEPLTEGWWTVRADSAVADSAGNVVVALEASFRAVAAADTARIRFRAFAGDTLGTGPFGGRIIAPWSRAGVALSLPTSPDSLREVIVVVDTIGNPLSVELSALGAGIIAVSPDPAPRAGQVFGIRVEPPLADSVTTAFFLRAGPDRLGELSGVVVAPDAAGPIVVELHPATDRPEPVRRAAADATGRFVFGGLPGGRGYRLRAFVDADGDGFWSGGALVPYTPAERIGWMDTVPSVRARWETALPDTLRIGSLPARVPPPSGNRP